MALKEFSFKGKSVEELKNLDLREFAKFITARKRRSLLRQIEKIEKFLKKNEKKLSKNKPVRTH